MSCTISIGGVLSAGDAAAKNKRLELGTWVQFPPPSAWNNVTSSLCSSSLADSELAPESGAPTHGLEHFHNTLSGTKFS